ncbi:hypothetical protein SKAU_G00317450 [Synaphobranchus kaupii]|uniref:Uncharacterized protein n=1 Tax=Synaphobranchus kaupii TaxID=118154 RepID=A0A9Q1ESX2_SYNKA|nr:hypothetical protein SKAU_G00317450 [Synaphobranchus kaupii]
MEKQLRLVTFQLLAARAFSMSFFERDALHAEEKDPRTLHSLTLPPCSRILHCIPGELLLECSGSLPSPSPVLLPVCPPCGVL